MSWSGVDMTVSDAERRGLAASGRFKIGVTRLRIETSLSNGIQSCPPLLECDPVAGQFRASFFDPSGAYFSLYWCGLRYPSAECNRFSW